MSMLPRLHRPRRLCSASGSWWEPWCMAGAAGGAGVIGVLTGTAAPSSTIVAFTSETATGAAVITVAAIVLDTPGIVPALPATVPALPATAPAILPPPRSVRPRAPPPPQPFQVQAIDPAIVLQLQLFRQIQAIARMLRTAVRGRAGGRRVLCRLIRGIVR